MTSGQANVDPIRSQIDKTNKQNSNWEIDKIDYILIKNQQKTTLWVEKLDAVPLVLPLQVGLSFLKRNDPL